MSPNCYHFAVGKTKNYSEHLLRELQAPEEAAAYLEACLKDFDPDVFLLALKDIAEARKEKTRTDLIQ